MPGEPCLVFRDGDGTEQVFVLSSGSASASVGRQPSSDLMLGWDDQVSRLHARFERAADDWELVDEDFSRNGTFVNGQRLKGRRRLADGDTLRFGSTTVTFRLPSRRAPQAPSASPAVPVSTTQRRVLAALCRPYVGASSAPGPASDEQMAEELFLSAGEVRAHLKVLYAKFEIQGAGEDERRARLAELAMSAGLAGDRDR